MKVKWTGSIIGIFFAIGAVQQTQSIELELIAKKIVSSHCTIKWMNSEISSVINTVVRSPIQRVSYSGWTSEKIPLDYILTNLMNFRNGTFIEVGGHDGIFQSNTKLFEEAYGWTGILVEPSPNLFDKLCSNRPNSKCFSCALGSFEEDQTYAYGDFNGGAMSSLTGRTDQPKNVKVLIRSLQSILDECGLTHINFFSLDTEGYELNILKGIDFNKTTIDYLLIEVYKHQYEDIVSYLSSKGYDLVGCITNYNHVSNPGWDGTHNDYLFKRRVW